MSSRSHVILLLLLALLTAACQDVPSAPTDRTDAAPGHTNTAARLDHRSPYGCYISSPNPERPGWWRYEQGPMTFPAAAVGRDTARLRYSFRRRAQDGSLAQVANCIIPRTGRAVGMMNRWLKVSPHARSQDTGQEGDAVLLSDTECEWNAKGVCVFKPLVVVAKLPSEEEEDTGGSGGDGGGPTFGDTGGTGDTYGGCSSCNYDSAPSLTCSAATRGATTTCQLSTSGSQSVSGSAWYFLPADGIGAIAGPSGGLTWSGQVVVGGRVQVTVTTADTTLLMETQLTVTPRGWTWANKGVSQYSDGTGTPCYTGTPVSDQPNGWNQGMDLTNPCAGDEKFIQPDSEGSADVNGPMDGFTLATVSDDGPNKGLHYVSNARLYLRRKSAYNPSLSITAPAETLGGWNVNHCPDYPMSANWQQFNRCKGVDVDGYLDGLRGHEGAGSNGGTGHYSAALRLVSETANDPMLFLDAAVGKPGQFREEFLGDLRDEFRTRMRRVEAGARPNADAGGLATGNWSGIIYRWTGSTATFEQYSSSI